MEFDSFDFLSNIFKKCVIEFNEKVGDKLPDVDLYEGTPKNKINLAELVRGKKVVVIGEVGAFTPCCTKVISSPYSSFSSLSFLNETQTEIYRFSIINKSFLEDVHFLEFLNSAVLSFVLLKNINIS